MQPHAAPGGDEGRWQHRPAKPGLQAPRGRQQQPVALTTARLGQVEVLEAGEERGPIDQLWPCAYACACVRVLLPECNNLSLPSLDMPAAVDSGRVV